jgi:hypothetical protein
VLLVLIAGVGLVLTPARAPRKAFAVGLAVAALVVVAVFFPSFARAAVNNGTAGACVIVAAVWALWFLAVTWPRSRAERRRAMPASGPPPPLPPQAAEPQEAAQEGEGHADR